MNGNNPTPADEGESLEPVSKHYSLASDYNLMGLALLGLFIAFATLFFVKKLDMDFWRALKWGSFSGSIVYAVTIIPSCWHFIKSNWGAVYQNALMAAPAPLSDASATDDVCPPAEQVGLQAGPRFLPPWYRPVGEPIKMTTDTNIEEEVAVDDINNQSFTIKYLINVTPAPGPWLPNFLRVPDKIALPYLKGAIQPKIEQKFKTLDGNYVLGHLDEFREWFRDVLGGRNRLSIHEKRVARFTGELVIVSVARSAAAQKVAATRKAILEAIETAEEAKGRVSDINSTTVFLTSAKMQGADVVVADVAIRGLENARHVVIGSEVLAGAGTGGGGKKNKGQQGKGGQGNKQPTPSPTPPPAPPANPPKPTI